MSGFRGWARDGDSLREASQRCQYVRRCDKLAGPRARPPQETELIASSGSFKSLVRDLAGSSLAALGATRPARSARGRLTLVTFHRVLPEAVRARYPLRGLAVTEEELAWLLGVLARHFQIATLHEAHRAWRAGEPSERPRLALTFDDGQRDNFDHARPVLAAAALPATFFVATGAVDDGAALWHDRLAFAAQQLLEREGPDGLATVCEPLGGAPLRTARDLVLRAKLLQPAARDAFMDAVDERNGGPTRPDWDGMMTWDQLRTLQREGHEIGSHSVSHALLPQCDDATLERELSGSRERLRQQLTADIGSLCYPNGDVDARTLAATRDAGYDVAVTTRWGTNTPAIPPLELQRCDMVSEHLRDRFGRLSEARLLWRLSALHPGSGRDRARQAHESMGP